MMLVAYRHAGKPAGRVFCIGVLLLAPALASFVQVWPDNPAALLPAIGGAFNTLFDTIFFILALFIARRLCRPKASLFRLTLPFFIAPCAISLVLGAALLALQLLLVPQLFEPLLLLLALGACVAQGLFFALVMFPFVLLITKNSLYRERMRLAFRLPALGGAVTNPTPLVASPVSEPDAAPADLPTSENPGA